MGDEMSRLFGTDGVRGVAGEGEELDCSLAVALGRAAVRVLGPHVLVGRDTRVSGPMLEQAIADGVRAEGGRCETAGVVPTPAVALLAREGLYDCGVVISASHNPPEYNGIKFFDASGFKLPDEVEDKMQEIVEQLRGDEVAPGGSVPVLEGAAQRYIDHAVEAVRALGVDFSGLKVALDCGHGASCATTPAALRALGAEVVAINDDPDGAQINVGCGSTHLAPITELLEARGADVALAHDGDADRLLAVAPGAAVADGDFIIAICARDMAERGCLPENLVVGTVMANLGFTRAMRERGIEVASTQVGDRYVLECMRARGAALGGEQSGHIVFLEHNTTGDGLVTACRLLAVMARTGKPLAELMGVMEKLPQALVNVRVRDKALYAGNEAIAAAESEAAAALGDAGRLLVRPSGTEPLIRVMVEAQTQGKAEKTAARVAETIASEIGA